MRLAMEGIMPSRVRFTENSLCCVVKPVCGCNTKKSVIIACVVTIVTSIIALAVSLSTTVSISGPYTERPLAGVGFLFSLFCIGIAIYQIFISVLLFWTLFKKNGSIYVCDLWYISHLTIIFGYSLFYVASFVACYLIAEYVFGVVIILFGIVYACLFGYFCAVVNTYSYMIGGPLYY